MKMIILASIFIIIIVFILNAASFNGIKGDILLDKKNDQKQKEK